MQDVVMVFARLVARLLLSRCPGTFGVDMLYPRPEYALEMIPFVQFRFIPV